MTDDENARQGTPPQPVILVVDDEKINRLLVSRRLEHAGYRVILAEDGYDALEIVQREDVDLVLLDVMMPGLDGYDVLRRLRGTQRSTHLPVIMVTARTQTEDTVEALALGADDYVTKPLDFSIVMARIRTQLARRLAERALAESEERYAAAMAGTNDGLWDWRLDSGTLFCSPRWNDIMGLPHDDTFRTLADWLGCVHPDDVRRLEGELTDHVGGQSGQFENEHRVRRGTGHRWVLARGRATRNAAGAVTRVAGSVTDITEGKVADALTGLANRVLFNDRLGRLVQHARRVPDFQFAVLYLDLDHFKTVNDSLGHSAGDQLLVESARRLEANVRATDSVARISADHHGDRLAGITVARLGGDEFAVILGGMHHPSDATRVAERLTNAIAAPFDIQGHEVFVTASVGIALNATGYERGEDMLRDADTALYRAKAAGRGRWELFDADMREQVVRRLRLETDLRYAVAREEFLLHYQPIVALRERRVTGLEALLRWKHPERGLVPPAEFLEIAEETGVIVQIGTWVLDHVCGQMVQWRAERPDERLPIVAINMSVRNMLSPGFVARAIEVVNRHGLDHSLIEFEITESVLMSDPEAMREVAVQLKSSGFRIAIDDFGTGYSSLSYLQRLPVDRLKLDRSFVQEMATEGGAQAVMESVVLLADRLRIEVVAEGIETLGQLEQVEEIGCGFGQGYYFSRPGPAHAVETSRGATLGLEARADTVSGEPSGPGS